MDHGTLRTGQATLPAYGLSFSPFSHLLTTCASSPSSRVSPGLSSISLKSPTSLIPGRFSCLTPAPSVIVNIFWRGRGVLSLGGVRCARWLLWLCHREAAVGTYTITSPCQRRDRDIPLGPGECLQELVCAAPATAARMEMKRTGG